MAGSRSTRAHSDPVTDCVAPDRSTGELRALRASLAEVSSVLRRLAGHHALLAGESRLRILALLRCAGELCVCDLASVLGMTPAAVSQHLSRLRSGGLVVSRRDGMMIYYRLADGAVGLLVGVPPLAPPAAAGG